MKRTVADSIKDMVNSHTELAFVSETVEHPNSDNTIELRGIVTMEDLDPCRHASGPRRRDPR